jgi:hypothetical protein
MTLNSGNNDDGDEIVIEMDSSSHVSEEFWLPRGKHDEVSYFAFHKQWVQSYLGGDILLGAQFKMSRLETKLQSQYQEWLPGRIRDASQFGEVGADPITSKLEHVAGANAEL